MRPMQERFNVPASQCVKNLFFDTLKAPFVHERGFLLEAQSRIELENKGFADLRLTAWLLRPKNGAVDEARTRDLHLGKVALYQLSYYRIKRGALGRNRTTDTVIFSHMLYRLSYQGIGDPEGARTLDLQRDRLAF